MHGDFGRRLDAKADFVAADLDDAEGNVVADNDPLIFLAQRTSMGRFLSVSAGGDRFGGRVER